jgi:hypothetical protein
MDQNYIVIKRRLINLDKITHIELRKKFVDFHFGDLKLSVNMKNTGNAEKQFQRLGKLLKTTAFDSSIKPARLKKNPEKEKQE